MLVTVRMQSLLKRRPLRSLALDSQQCWACVQLKMYPQLLWGAVAMLHTTYVPLFRLVLRLLHSLLSTLNLWNLPCQQVLQAASFTSPAALGTLGPSGTPCIT